MTPHDAASVRPGQAAPIARSVVALVLLLLVAATLDGGAPAADAASVGGCSPRPPVTVELAPAGQGALRATVRAGAGTLRRITFQRSTNAAVEMQGRSISSANADQVLSPGAASAQFVVRPARYGQTVTVPLEVVDDCGPWTTFVGGGAGVFGAEPVAATPTTPPTVRPTAPTQVPAPTATASPSPTVTPVATGTVVATPPSTVPTPAVQTPALPPPSMAPLPALPPGTRPAWDGVPRVALDYAQDVETWWDAHPFNPESTAYAPDIASPARRVDVLTEFGGNIQAAIDALPPDGGTLYLPAGLYVGAFRLIGRSGVHLIGEPGAVVRAETESKILGCALAEEYAAFGAAVHARQPAALACATTARIRDVYVRGLTFDGAGVALQAVQLSAAQDVVFDGVTFQNFRNPGDHHRGLVSGNASLENVWFRAIRFVGRERYALYLDGVHGGGVIGSRIENGFSGGGLLFLTNDDFSRDYDRSGRVELPEQRTSQYVVVYGNVFAGGTYDAVSATGRNILVKGNSVTGSLVTLANFQAKSSVVDANLRYEYLNNRVVGNRVRQARQLVEVAGPWNCPAGTNCALAGQYQVRDNLVEGAGTFVRFVTETAATFGGVVGPNVVRGNCLGTAGCP